MILLTDEPVIVSSCPVISRYHRIASGQHGIDDIVIARTAADIAFELCAYSSLVRLRIAIQQIHRAHNHPRCTEAALQSVMFLESGLHGMQRTIVIGKPLDGDDIATCCLRRDDRARLDGTSIKMNDAGTALTGITPHVRTGKTKMIAQ